MKTKLKYMHIQLSLPIRMQTPSLDTDKKKTIMVQKLKNISNSTICNQHQWMTAHTNFPMHSVHTTVCQCQLASTNHPQSKHRIQYSFIEGKSKMKSHSATRTSTCSIKISQSRWHTAQPSPSSWS